MSSSPAPSPRADDSTHDAVSITAAASAHQAAELRQARHEVETERRRYLDLFDGAPDRYLLTTANGVIRVANPAAAEMLNVPSHFVVGKPLAVYVEMPHRRDFRERLAVAGTTGAAGTWETVLQPRRSDVIPVTVTVSPSVTDGAVDSLLWLVRRPEESDSGAPPGAVSDHSIEREHGHHAEQAVVVDAAGALRLQTAVLSAIVEGLESPPVAISGYASVIRRLTRDWSHPDLPLLYEALAGMESSATAMGRLMGDLVSLARLPFGAGLDVALVDVVDITRRVAGSFTQETHGHQIRIEAARPWLYVTGDAERLGRVLGVLLTNAVMYSPEGGEIAVAIEQSMGEAVIRVRDPGVGIPAVDLPHIGGQRHRGVNVAAWTGGTGIGLVVARHLVEQHGGSLDIDSRQGVGSVVTVRLPVAGPSAGRD